MYKNVWYNKKTSQMHVWCNTHNIYDWVPYVFVGTDKKTKIKTTDGNPVIRKRFANYGKYKNFQKNNNDIYENELLPDIQFLAEKYSDVKDDDIVPPTLRIHALDIECHSDDGSFPKPSEAKWPVTVIGVHDSINECTYLLGTKEYTNTTLENKNVKYIKCKNEKALLKSYVLLTHKLKPDIITGWNIIPSYKFNISGFDIEYIVNRIKNTFTDDPDYWKKMSPLNKGMSYSDNNGNMNVLLPGITLIDYEAAYKMFSRNNPESYSLDFISKLELGKGKIDTSQYGGLKNLYNDNYNLYCDYNVIDVKRVVELEKKLGYINIIQSLSLISRCPMRHYQAMTTIIEGMFITYYRRNNICAPYFRGGTQGTFPAGYVKDPQKGLHKWVASIDIVSSYPTAIISLNMSNESYVGKVTSFTDNDIIEYTTKRQYPPFDMYNILSDSKSYIDGKRLVIFNKLLSKGLLCIAPNGVIFRRDIKGILSEVERQMFVKRKEVKGMMKKTTDKDEKNRMFTYQYSLKVILNSVFGATAVPYSRYFNLHIAEAIPACGKHTVRQGEKYINELLNEPNDVLKGILDEIRNE